MHTSTICKAIYIGQNVFGWKGRQKPNSNLTKKSGGGLFTVSCNWESQNSTNRMSSENSFVSIRGSPSGEQMFTSCFIDYAKAFDCVDHNKLWKF